MTGRRRPIAAFFTALLVWLTAISSFRGALPSQSRWLDVDGSGVASISIVTPRAAIAALRPTSRPLTPPSLDLAFPPAILTAASAEPTPRRHVASLTGVRLVQGLARTYDATAPPTQTR